METFVNFDCRKDLYFVEHSEGDWDTFINLDDAMKYAGNQLIIKHECDLGVIGFSEKIIYVVYTKDKDGKIVHRFASTSKEVAIGNFETNEYIYLNIYNIQIYDIGEYNFILSEDSISELQKELAFNYKSAYLWYK